MKIKTNLLISFGIMIAIASYLVIFNGIFQPIYGSFGNNNSSINDYTTYSNASNGIIFQYPSTWKIKYYNIDGPEINISNPIILNGILIGLLNQKMDGLILQYPTLQDFANKFFGTHGSRFCVENLSENTYLSLGYLPY